MCTWASRALAALVLLGAAFGAAAQARFEGIGRPATKAEIMAWDIDVRPDFKGLPKGSGTVARGMEIWEAQCASCHGVFGESNETFTPLVGGTTKDDIKTGRVARLRDEAYPQRTSMMKLSSLSTLWDYIHRAMPWQAPKTLSHDEVYAVTAYLLNLAGVLPDNGSLSDRNIREVQAALPNRDGKTWAHALWPGRTLPGTASRPDVQGTRCMRDCAAAPTIASSMPEHARNAHGNLAEQNRPVGAQVGADTSGAAGRTAAAVPAGGASTPPVQALLGQHNCLACHGVDRKLVGPGLREVAAKHANRTDVVGYLVQVIVKGGSGVWGAIPMPPQSLPAADARRIAEWLAAGAH